MFFKNDYHWMIIMKQILKGLLITSLTPGLISCAGNKKTSSSYVSGVTPEVKIAPKEKRTAIIGSAQIDKPSDYNGDTYFLYGAEHLKLKNYYFDIPVVYNAAVKKWIKFFVNRGREYFERYSSRAGKYAPILSKILAEHGLPKDLIFLAMAESGFNNRAKSWAKAVGPWQFMPATGKKFGLSYDWYIDERRDPIKATIGAAKYLKVLYKMFGSWELATAAYNAGEGKIKRAIRRYNTENFWKLRKGRYLRPETKNYVPKIMALAIIGKNLSSFGLNDIEFEGPLDFDEIVLPPFTDLDKIAKDLNLEFDEILNLNPEISRWYTPPQRPYTLRVPVGKGEVWSACCVGKDYLATKFRPYKVRGKRTTLSDVARKFKLKSAVLKDFNDFGVKDRLKKGTMVYLPFRENEGPRHPLYTDLFDKPRKSVRRSRRYRRRISLAKKRGRKIVNPSAYYTVKKGDTLWTVARKNGISLDTLIVSNIRIVKSRMIREGDKLAVR
jgi:membrane-bound lytic murein transglycosylase D